jgi:HEAT repeat protein
MEPKQIDELFAQTLTHDYDDESPWAAVRSLRRVGDRDVFNRAAEWCLSDIPLKRARGADVLAQLGNTAEHPGNAFPEECFSVVSTLLHGEGETLPLLAAIHALGHINNSLAVPLIIKHQRHPDPDVRFAAACALGSFANDPRSVGALLELMRDTDEDVRDWAFGLGVQGDFDSEEIRDALCQRLTDSDRDVREEALVGLAKRKDERVLPSLIGELSQSEISYRVKEAAEALLGQNEPRDNLTPSDYALVLRNRFAQ